MPERREMTEQIDWWAKQSGSLLGRSEVLGSLRQYLRAQSQGHHTIDRLGERDVEKGSTRRSFMKGGERASVNQMNIGTVLKVAMGKLLCTWAFPSI